MESKIIFLKPHLDAKIWGGQRLQEFGYLNHDSDAKIGEALIVSALKNAASIILNSEYQGMRLDQFYDENRAFFGNYQGQYPILTKIIDANADLSIQVHPDDRYAKLKHNGSGKTECWYILDAPTNAEIVYGLKTQNQATTIKLIEQQKWTQLLNYVSVKKNDVLFVPSGMVHAITKGILLYELQQSSDITYRLYDYDRKDENGNFRPLHITDAINVIQYDFDNNYQSQTHLIDCSHFKLKKYEIQEQLNLIIEDAYWLEITVIAGKGKVDNIDVKKGTVFLVKHNHLVEIKGQLTILVAYIKK